MDTMSYSSELVAVACDGVQLEDWPTFTLGMNQFHAQRELKPSLSWAFLLALYESLLTSCQPPTWEPLGAVDSRPVWVPEPLLFGARWSYRELKTPITRLTMAYAKRVSTARHGKT